MRVISRTFLFLFMISGCCIMAGCQKSKSRNLTEDHPDKKAMIITTDIPENAVKGDYNGDGVPEYMWLVAPEVADMETGCNGDCISYIKFSDPSIPEIKIENCIGGVPTNKGDLNQNGSDEIGLLPEWFTSCWHAYYVWTFLNGKWVYAVEPFSTHCQQWEEGVNPIEIDPQRKGYVIIRYSDFDKESTEIVTKSKSVKIIK